MKSWSLHLTFAILVILCVACSSSTSPHNITQIKPGIETFRVSNGEVIRQITQRVFGNFQTADIEMKNGEEHVFTFGAHEGQYLNVAPVATPADLDLRLKLNTYRGQAFEGSGEGTLVAVDDNGGLGVNPRL